jgi:hypothetical protein
VADVANELYRTNEWIYYRTSNDATITGHVGARIFQGFAPQRTEYPFVAYGHRDGSGEDVHFVGAERSKSRGLFFIKAVCRDAPTAALYAVADRLDDLFKQVRGETRNGYVFHCQREKWLEFKAPDANTDVIFYHLGGWFRITVHPA